MQLVSPMDSHLEVFSSPAISQKPEIACRRGQLLPEGSPKWSDPAEDQRIDMARAIDVGRQDGIWKSLGEALFHLSLTLNQIELRSNWLLVNSGRPSSWYSGELEAGLSQTRGEGTWRRDGLWKT